MLITHDMGVIAGRTDRVMVMYAGKIVEGRRPPELFAQMRHPYAEALLDSIPQDGQPTRASRSTASRASRPTFAVNHRLPVRAALPLRDGGVPGRGAAAPR